jgi:hypothetical protein
MWKAGVAIVLLVLVLAPVGLTQGATEDWTISFKGKTKTFDGQTFPFEAVGTMEWDPMSGAMSFEVSSNTSGPFSGAGTLVRNPKNVGWGLTSFDMGAGSSSSIGSAIFSGKFKTSKKGSKFSGKVTAASPYRLGAPPGGFTMTTGKVKAEKVP